MAYAGPPEELLMDVIAFMDDFPERSGDLIDVLHDAFILADGDSWTREDVWELADRFFGIAFGIVEQRFAN